MSKKKNPDLIPKRVTSFSLDDSILKEFDEMCRKETKNRSRVLNNILGDFVNKNKKRS